MSSQRIEQSSRRQHVTPSTTDKPVYGNFQRYYHIRNPANHTACNEETDVNGSSSHPALALDSRVSSILGYITEHCTGSKAVATTAEGLVNVLDVGCNSGKLTIQLAQTLPALLRYAATVSDPAKVHITGVDIDPLLVKQAQEAASFARSCHRPFGRSTTTSGHQSQKPTNFQLPAEAAFFPSVFPRLFGPVPDNVDDTQVAQSPKRHKQEEAGDGGSDRHLYLSAPQLRFLAAEWVDPSSSRDSPFRYPVASLSKLKLIESRGLSLILALSLTKWIHIQQSDSGLILFLARVAHTLLPGGLLFLERQEWRSYHSAKNMEPSIKHKIKALQLRAGGDFDYLLDSMGLELIETIGYGRGLGFQRPLQVFRKVGGEEEMRLVEQLLESKGEGFKWVARSSAAAGS